MTDATQYINNIDPSYPVPGKDNNTQGFRSNFANIQQALTTLEQNFNNIAANTVNINSPKITATQSMTSLGPLYIGTQTFAYVTDVDHKLSVVGVDSRGSPAAGEVAFSPSIVTISTNPDSVTTDSVGTYFVTSSPTSGLLVGGVFYCPSTGTGPFTITNIAGSKIYFTGAGGLDPSVDVTNPVFNKNTVLTTSTVIPFFGKGFPGAIIVDSATPSTSSNSGALVVRGGAGVAGNVNIAGTATMAGAVITGDLSVTGNINFGRQGNFVSNFTNGSTTSTNTSTGYQKLPGGLIMAWGYIPRMPSRGAIQICLPTFSGNITPGFPNAVMSVQATPIVPNNFITYFAPVYDPDVYISGRTQTSDYISGGNSVSNVTARNFLYTYYQNIVSYPCVPQAQPYTVVTRYLNTAGVYWSAIGY